MKTSTIKTNAMPNAPVGKTWDEASASFDRFYRSPGGRHGDAGRDDGGGRSRRPAGRGIRAARTGSAIAGGARRARSASMPASSQWSDLGSAGSTERNCRCQAGSRRSREDWLGRWAMNLMLINVSTRKFRRAVRLPEGDVPAPAWSGVSKSAASRHFVAPRPPACGKADASDRPSSTCWLCRSTAFT